MTCTVSGTTCADDTHTAPIAAGHYAEVQVANPSAGSANAFFVVTFTY